MKWLNSLDELLYEVMSWLIFYPITLMRTIFRPLFMMQYADRQLSLADDEQYADALSPPLFLALSLIISNATATALGEADMMIASQHGLAALIDDATSAIVFRIMIFAIFPLMMAVAAVKARDGKLNRTSLRLPFYAHCYPAAVFALSLSLGVSVAGASWHRADDVGHMISLIGVIYYLAAATAWFASNTKAGRVRAFFRAFGAFAAGVALLLLVGLVFLG